MNAVPPHKRRLGKAGRGFARRSFRAYLPFSRAFHRILDRIDTGLEAGSLEGHLPDGTIRMLGNRAPGPHAIVHLRSWRALLRLAAAGSVGWYRAWELGEWTSPDPVPLFDLFMRNGKALGGAARARGLPRLINRISHAFHRNSRRGARRNIAFHYDLGNDFYNLWLDRNMHYSSALFAEPYSDRESLEDAQTRKADAIIDRLDLRPGASLLEIGCGWGGLAERALERAPVDYHGLTLSAEQATLARTRVAASGDDAHIHLTDYRDARGQYDAIASVEMVEAVGERYWPDYLDAIVRLLKPGGRAAIQYIAIDDALFESYAASADFIQAYIFPGGMLMSDGRFRALAEARGLEWRDEHRFGLHYAETLKRWRARFDAAIERGALPPAFDARFVRLWRYYLMYCEGGFRGRGIDVAQVTLGR